MTDSNLILLVVESGSRPIKREKLLVLLDEMSKPLGRDLGFVDFSWTPSGRRSQEMQDAITELVLGGLLWEKRTRICGDDHWEYEYGVTKAGKEMLC